MRNKTHTRIPAALEEQLDDILGQGTDTAADHVEIFYTVSPVRLRCFFEDSRGRIGSENEKTESIGEDGRRRWDWCWGAMGLRCKGRNVALDPSGMCAMPLVEYVAAVRYLIPQTYVFYRHPDAKNARSPHGSSFSCHLPPALSHADALLVQAMYRYPRHQYSPNGEHKREDLGYALEGTETSAGASLLPSASTITYSDGRSTYFSSPGYPTRCSRRYEGNGFSSSYDPTLRNYHLHARTAARYTYSSAILFLDKTLQLSHVPHTPPNVPSSHIRHSLYVPSFLDVYA